MGFLQNLGQATGNNLVNVGMGALNSYVQGAINEKWAKVAREENFKYNEKAADSADARQRAQFNDMYSIGAQMRQLKENNLSPSLMMGGTPSQGGATAPIGKGAGGLMGNPTAHFDPMNAAEIELMQAQAAKLREETKTEAGDNKRGAGEISNLFAEGERLLAEKGNLEFSSEFLKAKTTWQTIENRFAEPMAEMKLKLFDADFQQIIATTDKIKQEAKAQGMSNKLFEENFDTHSAQIKAGLQKTLAETGLLLARRQESVKNLSFMDAQMNYMSQQIMQGWKKLEIQGADQEAQQKFYEASARNMLRTYNLQERQFEALKGWKNTEFGLEKRGQNLTFIANCIHAYISSQNALLYSVSNVINGLSPGTALSGAASSATRVRGFQ